MLERSLIDSNFQQIDALMQSPPHQLSLSRDRVV